MVKYVPMWSVYFTLEVGSEPFSLKKWFIVSLKYTTPTTITLSEEYHTVLSVSVFFQNKTH